MDCEHARTVRALMALVLAMTFVVVASAHASAAAWWVRVGFAGQRISAVAASGSAVIARTADGASWSSFDGGRHFESTPGKGTGTPGTAAIPGTGVWRITAGGQVTYETAGGSAKPDTRAPALGAGAGLIAAPAAAPGVVVAVATDGTVWRRSAGGSWSRSLLLLPRSAVQGVPRITAVTAFDEPLSATVYLATDGYSVLDSTDGGDDWIRAGPGLPDTVYALAADAQTHVVYAGTADGLWTHTLQAFPAPPTYHDADLVLRWLGIGAVTLIASVLAVAGIAGALRPRRSA